MASTVKPDPDAPAQAAAPAAAPDSINITVVENNSELAFKIKTGMKMSRLMTAYAGQRNKDEKLLRFHFDGQRIMKDDTASTLEMQEGDTVNVFMEQRGGR